MKLSILSCSPKCYSTRRLVEAGRQRGHRIEVLNTLRLTIGLDQGTPSLFDHGKPLKVPEEILPRVGTSITRYGTAVVRQFEQMDNFTPNTAAGITLEETGLRELDVAVLILRRKGMAVSNPKSSRVLEAEDSLLSYGKSEPMKGLIPSKSKKRRKVRKLPEKPDA